MSDANIQAGCFTRLFSFVKTRTLRPPTGSNPGNGGNAEKEGSVQKVALNPPRSWMDKPELPSYAQTTQPCHCAGQWHSSYPRDNVEKVPPYIAEDIFRPEVVETIEATIEQLGPELRKLSLDIWNHPELGYQEHRTHDVLAKFMAEHDFNVTPHYLEMPTAFQATFSHRADASTRVIGINSEMDALAGIGHACGHNLIAIAGVGVALALRAAMEKHDVPGTIVLLGTPAEETEGGKIELLKRGAYDNMDICVMCHPCVGPEKWVSIGPSLACQHLVVEFHGRTAHAAWAPWEAQNALDAAVLTYNAISVLRQQIQPTHRVHGIVSGRDWSPNVIPDYAQMHWIVRTPSYLDLEVLAKRVRACFEAAAHATGCTLEVSAAPAYYDNSQNPTLGTEFAHVVGERDGVKAVFDGGMGASTDFGNVTYVLPSLHPNFAIPTVPNGGNHTVQFAQSASEPAAHTATLSVIKGLAATAFRVLDDKAFYETVKKSFEDAKAARAC